MAMLIYSVCCFLNFIFGKMQVMAITTPLKCSLKTANVIFTVSTSRDLRSLDDQSLPQLNA